MSHLKLVTHIKWDIVSPRPTLIALQKFLNFQNKKGALARGALFLAASCLTGKFQVQYAGLGILWLAHEIILV
jgi:hypothetical protein